MISTRKTQYLERTLGILLVFLFSIKVFAQTMQVTDGKFSGNLFPGDTSFETGLHPAMLGVLSWGYPVNSSFDDRIFYYGEIDGSDGFDGKQSLKLPKNSLLNLSCGVPIILENGETYTFSFYAKAKKAGAGQISFQSMDWKHVERKNISFTTEWKRYSTTIQAKEKNYFTLVSFANEIWIDCLQLEKGNAPTPYRNGEPVTVNINFAPESKRIFFPEDKIRAQLVVRKVSPDANYKDLSIKYTITDFYRKIIKDEEIAVTFDDKNIFIKELDLSSKELGSFLIRYQLESDSRRVNNQAFDTYAIIKPPVKIKDGMDAFCGYDMRETTLQTLKCVGVQWTEVRSGWKSVESEKGKFNWSGMDELIYSLKQEGFRIKVALQDWPQWAMEPLDEQITKKMSAVEIQKSKDWGILPADLEDWRNFVRRFVARYDDKIDLYEIGLEFDLVIGDHLYYRMKYPEHIKGRFICSGPIIDKYAQMIKIASEEILKVNPKAKIGAIRPANTDCDEGFPFSTAVLEKAGKYFNLFPMDPYTGPRMIGPGQVETRDPEYLAGIFKKAAEAFEKYGGGQNIYVSELGWYYDLLDGFMTESSEKGTKKIIRSCLISRMSPKVVYWHQVGGNSPFCKYTDHLRAWGFYPTILVPAYSMAARIVENVCSSKEVALGPLVKAAVFAKDDQAAGVIWTIDNDKKSFELPSLRDISVLDVIGNPVKIEKKGDKLIVPIDGFPVYFVQEGGNCADELFKTLASGKVRGIPFEAFFRPVSSNQGELFLKNLTDNRLKGKVNILAEGQKPFEQQFAIPVSETNALKFPLAADIGIGKTRKIRVEADCPGEDKVIAGFPLEPLMECKKISFPIKVDGDIKKWEKQPGILMNKRSQIEPSDPWIRWDGPEHFGAKVYIGWNENALYVGVEVADEKHFNKQRGGNRIHNGDSVQLAFDFGNDAALRDKSSGYDDNDRDFIIALTDYGVSSWRLPEKSELAIVRKGDKTCYEVSIPKSALPKEFMLSPGAVMGFNFVIFNDNDGGGQTHYYYLSRGITGGKDPRQFKKIILTE